MVRHHVKGKKKKVIKKDVEEKKKQKDMLKDLDRFAGSSEEEGPNDDTDDESLGSVQADIDDDDSGENEADVDQDDGDNSSDDDEYGESTVKNNNRMPKKTSAGTDSDDESSDDDATNDQSTQRGMSGAMSRILGLKAPAKAKETKSVVLSKTFTPLQKQQKKEKEEREALRLKRKQRRDVSLTALHVPLSAATSRPILGKNGASDAIANAMGKEIEIESMHRRVATRGVVALFNTIAQHQQQRAQLQENSGTSTKKGEEVKTMSKHGFLDMLKKTGTSKTGGSEETSKQTKSSEKSSEKKSNKGWNALKDDFMMASKLKDWDKALSSDDDEEDSDDNDEGKGGKGNRSKEKGVKRSVDDDAVMDDDWSSDDEKPKKRKLDA